jgi:hypothetical protein
MRKLFRKFYPIIGPEPYCFMGKDRIHGEEPPLVQALRDIELAP